MRVHKFRATERVPGWCARCGEAPWTDKHVPGHLPLGCRPETCGGVSYDPCPAAIRAELDVRRVGE